MLEWIKVLGRLLYDRRMRQRMLGYRPVVMSLIQATDTDQWLFIRPAAKAHAWMPPQEGIEPGESVEQAAIRGIESELGVSESQVHFRRSQWLGSKRIPEQTGERDIEYSLVKMRGKAYYGALVKMSQSTSINLNNAELAGFEWLTVEQVRERLETNSERKQELIRKLFSGLLNIDI